MEGYQTFTKRFRVREPPIFLACLVIVCEKIGVGKKSRHFEKKRREDYLRKIGVMHGTLGGPPFSLAPVERNVFHRKSRRSSRWRLRFIESRSRSTVCDPSLTESPRSHETNTRFDRRCWRLSRATFFLLGVRVTRANDACAPAVRRAEEHGIAARARESTTARRALEALRRTRATRTATGPRDTRRAPRRID